MKELYALLNDTKNPLHEENLTEQEIKQLRALVATKSRRPRRFLRYALPLAALLIFGIILTPFGKMAIADGAVQLNAVHISLSQAMGREKNIDNYATDVGQTIYLGEISTKVANIVLDGKELVVHLIIESNDSKKKVEDLTNVSLSQLQIDGENYKINGSSGSLGPLKEHPGIFDSLIVYHLDKTLPADGTHHLKMDFVSDLGIIPRAGRVEFDADIATLSKNLNKRSLNLNLGEGFKLSKMRFSDVSQQLVLTHKDATMAAKSLYLLRGYDDQGRKVEFWLSHDGPIEDGTYQAVMKPEQNNSELNPEQLLNESKSLTLQLYESRLPEQSGRMETDFRAIGKPVTFELH